MLQANATLDVHAEDHYHGTHNSDSVRKATVEVTGIVYCEMHPRIMVCRKGLFGRMIVEKCPTCEQEAKLDLASSPVSPSSNATRQISESSELCEAEPVLGQEEAESDAPSSVSVENEQSLPECDMDDTPHTVTSALQRQEARLVYEEAMKEGAESAVASWKKGRSTKSLDVTPLEEALMDAGTRRINNASDKCISFVDTFLDETETAYKAMRVAERDYLWTLAEDKKSKLNTIKTVAPDYSADRLDPAEVIQAQGSSDQIRLMCQTNILVEALTLQMGTLLADNKALLADNKALLTKVTSLEEKLAKVELFTCNSRFSIKDKGYTSADAREAGYSCQEAREAGYSCKEAREVGYSLKEIHEAGYSCKEVHEAGYSLQEIARRSARLATRCKRSARLATRARKSTRLATRCRRSMMLATRAPKL